MHPMYAMAHTHVHIEINMSMNFPAAFPHQLQEHGAMLPRWMLSRECKGHRCHAMLLLPVSLPSCWKGDL